MLQTIAVVELTVCWVIWALSFVAAKKRAAGQKKAARSPRSRWGIVLQMIGFSCVFVRALPVGFEKSTASLIVSMMIAPLPVLLAWAATRHLGKQWQFEAAVNEDHELIQTGPYAWVRHPIYTSMLGLLLAAGAALTWWPMFVAGVVFFLIGTGIRVRLEDRLLADRFGEQFLAYRARVRAFIPSIRPKPVAASVQAPAPS
jgi:protein-S-isoprenylcysteine O-methyltransferase Ste14